MGFLLPQTVLGTTLTSTSGSSSAGTATSWPTGIADGDLVFLLFSTQTGSSPFTPCVPSSGWTSIDGGSFPPSGGVWGFYYHTYAAGDAAPTLSRAAVWIMVAVRSDTMNAAALLAAMHDAALSGSASGTVSYPSSAASGGDLRLNFVVTDGNYAGTVTDPVPPVSAGNQFQYGFRVGAQASASITTFGVRMDASIYPDVNTDTASSTWSAAGVARYATHAISFHDGSGRNGWHSDEVDPFECVVPIFAVEPEATFQRDIDTVTVWVT